MGTILSIKSEKLKNRTSKTKAYCLKRLEGFHVLSIDNKTSVKIPNYLSTPYYTSDPKIQALLENEPQVVEKNKITTEDKLRMQADSPVKVKLV